MVDSFEISVPQPVLDDLAARLGRACLSDDTASGWEGGTNHAFDVVVSSLPGYGFSEQREGGGGIFGVGDLWHHLMTAELGYSHFAAHGGDWGSTVTEHLGRSSGPCAAGSDEANKAAEFTEKVWLSEEQRAPPARASRASRTRNALR